MKNIFKRGILSIVGLFVVSFSSIGQNQNFDLGKYFEIHSTVLRTLNSQYVDTLDLSKLMESSLNGMLSSLDPYTVFIPEENEDDIEILTTGAYGGVGAVIQKRHPSGEIVVSQVYENSPAVKHNIEPGDVILEVGGVSTLELSVTECSEKMRGRAGSKIPMTIKKGRGGDTIVVNLLREKVHTSDVVYAGFVNDTTGYIEIGGFTLSGSEDVKQAYMKLCKEGDLRQLILDLRGNGGGLMSEAVDLLSLFLPKGTLVVSAKGKHPDANFEYRTEKEPLDTIIPLMVMVNSSSASSSEIVAGAIQDLDRGVIAGERTFGKGLVQSIRSTGYNSSLKLTTAKYYTPSGRSLQAIDYSHRNENGSAESIPDSLRREFKTRSGRSVYDGGGITPDIKLGTFYYSRPVVSLVYGDVLNMYALEYYKRNLSIENPSDFRLSDVEYADFVEYAVQKEFDVRSEAYLQMENVIKTAEDEGLFSINPSLKEELEEMLQRLDVTKEEFLISNKEVIRPLLEEEISTKFYYRAGGSESALKYDTQIQSAIEQWREVIL